MNTNTLTKCFNTKPSNFKEEKAEANLPFDFNCDYIDKIDPKSLYDC